MRTNSSNKRGIIFKILPGLLLILFSFFMLAYYPSSHASSSKPQKYVYLSASYQNQFAKYMKNTSSEEQLAKRIKSYEKKAKKKINYKSSVPYKVAINRIENFVMIYGIDINGKYKIPYKCFVCSTAKKVDNTLLGDYRLNDRYRWHSMVDGSYSQYAIRFYDTLMLHSVPYFEQSPDTLETKEYNKLGESASLGCARMRVSDIKWIYDHCTYGTEIQIYDKKGEEPPIPYEQPKRLNPKDSKSCWDPTDPDKKNPWNK